MATSSAGEGGRTSNTPSTPMATASTSTPIGPISFLFREHDIYPATVIDGGMRNLYHINLLGTHFLGDYRVQPNRQQIVSTLGNDWATAHETLNKSTTPAF